MGSVGAQGGLTERVPGGQEVAERVGGCERVGCKAAIRELDQRKVDAEFDRVDILSNCRQYPLDEAPNAYKDFGEVVKWVEQAGLASTVAKLRARFVIKDNDKQYGGAA